MIRFFSPRKRFIFLDFELSYFFSKRYFRDTVKLGSHKLHSILGTKQYKADFVHIFINVSSKYFR